jgi:hypothetical protein
MRSLAAPIRPECNTASFMQVDPQARQIWLETDLPVSEERIVSSAPLGVFVSGKASSEEAARRLGRGLSACA